MGGYYSNGEGGNGLVACTFSGKLKDVYLNGSMPGKVAVAFSWADYTTWGLKAGIVCGTSKGGVLENVIIDVKCDEGTDIKAVAGAGTVTYGVVMLITTNNNTNSTWHDGYAYLAGALTVEGSIEHGYEKGVFACMQSNSPNVWKAEDGELPTLIPNCTGVVPTVSE